MEDVVYMFEQAGIDTRVNLAELVNVGVWISQELKKQNESRAGSALAMKQNAIVSSSSRNTDNKMNSTRQDPRVLNWVPQTSPKGLQILKSGTNVKVVLNRPCNGNALTSTTISSLTNLFEKATMDQSVTRIIIAAKGKFFCTGMDLARGSSPVADGQSASEAQFKRLTRLFEAIENAPQVTIARVQGPSFGGGVGLAFACDVRIIARSASMTLSEVKLGLCPATISKYVIREWGTAFAREAMLSGRTVSSSEMASRGIVCPVVEDGSQLWTVTDEYLTKLKSSAPYASSMSKELARLSWIDGGGGSNQAEGIRKLFDEMMASNEATHGLMQFQKGNKELNWDSYTLEKSGLVAKL